MWLSCHVALYPSCSRYIPLYWIIFFSLAPSDTLVRDGKLQSEDTGSKQPEPREEFFHFCAALDYTWYGLVTVRMMIHMLPIPGKMLWPTWMLLKDWHHWPLTDNVTYPNCAKHEMWRMKCTWACCFGVWKKDCTTLANDSGLWILGK